MQKLQEKSRKDAQKPLAACKLRLRILEGDWKHELDACRGHVFFDSRIRLLSSLPKLFLMSFFMAESLSSPINRLALGKVIDFFNDSSASGGHSDELLINEVL